eukprot:CAMPEP_0181368120 /NCGR_PEP_ID=MMETSP1106-20121128/11877_1 /TAXON_ID=81844 /ORGANISM="Mantoniella antarctica, Strain SL-175" /LENGTH=117 /DNA_ID=CAMNT_0023484133 /DNA_START=114 /DNA_END=467 /DNA_ORIENTATION=-
MDAFVMVDGDEAGDCKRKRECLRARVNPDGFDALGSRAQRAQLQCRSDAESHEQPKGDGHGAWVICEKRVIEQKDRTRHSEKRACCDDAVVHNTLRLEDLQRRWLVGAEMGRCHRGL